MNEQDFIIILFYDNGGEPHVVTTCDRALTPAEFEYVDRAVEQTQHNGASGFVMCMGPEPGAGDLQGNNRSRTGDRK